MVRSNLSRNGVIYEVNVFVSVSFSINNTKASSIVCVYTYLCVRSRKDGMFESAHKKGVEECV